MTCMTHCCGHYAHTTSSLSLGNGLITFGRKKKWRPCALAERSNWTGAASPAALAVQQQTGQRRHCGRKRCTYRLPRRPPATAVQNVPRSACYLVCSPPANPSPPLRHRRRRRLRQAAVSVGPAKKKKARPA